MVRQAINQGTKITFMLKQISAKHQKSASIKPLLLIASAVICDFSYAEEQTCTTFFDSSDVYQLDSLDKQKRVSLAEGKTIKKIHFYLLDVFDESNEDENNALFRLLNSIHINTKEYVIRDQLLFKQGDLAKTKQLVETERLLRNKHYLTDAFILPEKICGNGVEIAVITRDTWALELEGSFGQAGGDTSTSIGVKSGNLFGTGNLLTLDYVVEDGQNKIVTKTENPSLFGTRFSSAAAYADTSDGEEKLITLNRHFYSLNSKWSFESKYSTITLLEEEEYLSTTNNEYFRDTGEAYLIFGQSEGLINNKTTRYYLGLTQNKDKFTETDETSNSLPDDRIRNYAWVGFKRIENDYGKFRNINQIQRTEDIQLGQEFNANLGFGLKDFDNKKEFLHINGLYEDALSIGKHHLTRFEINYEGNYLTDDKSAENLIVGAKINYFHYLNTNQRWYGSLRYDKGFGLTSDQELTFKEKTLVRGYPSNYQKGDKRLLASIEHRRFYNMHIFNVIRVGRVYFADLARAWDNDNASQSNLLSDIGFGLRFSSSKVRVGNVAHLDIAMPLNDKSKVDSFQFTLRAYQEF